MTRKSTAKKQKTKTRKSAKKRPRSNFLFRADPLADELPEGFLLNDLNLTLGVSEVVVAESPTVKQRPIPSH